MPNIYIALVLLISLYVSNSTFAYGNENNNKSIGTHSICPKPIVSWVVRAHFLYNEDNFVVIGKNGLIRPHIKSSKECPCRNLKIKVAQGNFRT